MSPKLLLISICAISYLFSLDHKDVGQKHAFQFNFDTLKIPTFINTEIFLSASQLNVTDLYLHHSPDEEDRQILNDDAQLIDQKPDPENYRKYYRLACALWEVEKLEEAEKMFLAIIGSKKKYYTSTYYHSSDVPGDTAKKVYGYGSYTSNYKNSAAIYLTKIYIEQKKFDQALKYMDLAANKYKVAYSCGTGFHAQQEKYQALYAHCYYGLGKYQTVVYLLLPEFLNEGNELLAKSIANLYAPAEIKEALIQAEFSIEYAVDSLPQYSYTVTTSDDGVEKRDSSAFYPYKASIKLFDHKVDFPNYYWIHKEKVNRDILVKDFKESLLYKKLAIMVGLLKAEAEYQ